MRVPNRRHMKRSRGHEGPNQRVYTMDGSGFFSTLGGIAKRAGKALLGQAKTILPAVAKELGPTLLTAASAKLGEKASKAGVSDKTVNAGAQVAQKLAQTLGSAIPAQTMSKNQGMVKDLIANAALQKLQQYAGKGVRGFGGYGVRQFGTGVRQFGTGVRQFGTGLEAVEAPRVGTQPQ